MLKIGGDGRDADVRLYPPTHLHIAASMAPSGTHIDVGRHFSIWRSQARWGELSGSQITGRLQQGTCVIFKRYLCSMEWVIEADQ
jgi:hypothetical protein